MNLTATHINYYIICHRKLWLFANGITMEHTSDMVYDGKLLHETSYPQRSDKYSEIEISASYEGIDLFGKIDFYDAKNKIIHETKRSCKIEKAHEWQAKFYIWLLALNGIEDVTAILEYPTMREKTTVNLHETDRVFLAETIKTIAALVSAERCPARINSPICKSCSYYELCYVEE